MHEGVSVTLGLAGAGGESNVSPSLPQLAVPTDLFLGSPAAQPHGAGEDAFPGRERRETQEPDRLYGLHGQRGSLQRRRRWASEPPHPGPDPASRWGRGAAGEGVGGTWQLCSRAGGCGGSTLAGLGTLAAEMMGWAPRPHEMVSRGGEHSPKRGADMRGLRRQAVPREPWREPADVPCAPHIL